ncbi:MAG: Uma2 family endonuclease [Chloroflexi bacterium]|nr:Uma2 family endonuclease [Chloroflexota bacterium]
MAIAKGLVTAEELARLPDDGFRYELIDGELKQMPPVGGEHGGVTTDFASTLRTYVKAHGLGWVLAGDTGVLLRRDPDHVRMPDVCFVSRERLPEGRLPKGHLPFVPDLVVEVVSPYDRASEVQAKIGEWLTGGARLVWAVYPDTRQIVAYRSLTEIRIYGERDVIDAEPVLPGFKTSVAELFD